VLGATVLRIKTPTLTSPSEVTDQPIELPGPDQISAQQPEFSSSPFVTGISVRRGRRRFLQRHRRHAGFSAVDLHQCRPQRPFRAAAGRRVDLARWGIPDRPDGAGLAIARLADARGYFGRAVQSLVVEKR
jgi:hypothetical protein